MKFYKLKCSKDTNYKCLYELLESIGSFIIEKDVILFYANRVKRPSFAKLNASFTEIDATTYKTGNVLTDEWIQSNYRKFRVDSLLKEAETEKQDELKSLYKVIKAAEEILERKEDLVE